jgi:hypothetical protein
LIRFIRRGGKIIPLNMSAARQFTNGIQKVPREVEHIFEVRKARKIIATGSQKLDQLGWTFWKYTRDRAKVTGGKIGKRIARFKMKGIIK